MGKSPGFGRSRTRSSRGDEAPINFGFWTPDFGLLRMSLLTSATTAGEHRQAVEVSDPSLHVLRDGCEVLQRRLQVLGDVLSDDMGRRQIGGFLKRFVFQPEDVEVHLVALC